MRHELREYISRRSAAFVLTAMLIVSTISMPAVLAYFSDYAYASGSEYIHLAWQTELKEDVRENNKHITIDNIGETPVIVRVQVFASEELASISGDAWTDGNDGWWYYTKILEAGQVMPEADELLVEVKGADTLPDEAFSIIVVHESSRVVYETNNKLAAPEGWAYVPAAQ
ncbi:MAG: hypothetical protein J6D57_08240 [Mogibacterium sp.]|nr:hypothetical protein [Mogibacterium sp.]